MSAGVYSGRAGASDLSAAPARSAAPAVRAAPAASVAQDVPAAIAGAVLPMSPAADRLLGQAGPWGIVCGVLAVLIVFTILE